jgi:peptidoglycan/xylan/chitin deacetylase (PgdA/CDA1 family)
VDGARERDELERGLEALDAIAVRPRGYRSPAWELTPLTFDLLGQYAFVYDSSLMGDDRPYRLAGGLVELPVHWSLDDVPYLAYHPERPTGLSHPRDLLAMWCDAADLARAEDRHLTYTMHPEHAGRTHLLRGLLDHLTSTGTPIVTHAQAAHAALEAGRTPGP